MMRLGQCLSYFGRIRVVAISIAIALLIYFLLLMETSIGRPSVTRSILKYVGGRDTGSFDSKDPKLFDVTDAAQYSRIIRFNVSDNGKQCKGRRFLVFHCSRICGGWGDRLKGISSAFMLAQLTNRTFLIDMKAPCELNTLLQPNLYDWNKCLSEAKAVPSNSKHRLVRYRGMPLKEIDELMVGKLANYTVIEFLSNQQELRRIKTHKRAGEFMPWIHKFSNADIMGSIFGILFRPSLNLSDALDGIKTIIRNRKLVCGHLRFGKNPTIPRDNKERNPNLDVVLHFLKNFDNMDDTAIFVATDSEEIRNQASKMFTNLILTGRRITHVDRSRGDSDVLCDGFFSSLLEQQVLSRCDVLVLTRSNFGLTAAYMRATSSNLYLNILNTTHILAVDASDIYDIHKHGFYDQQMKDISNYQKSQSRSTESTDGKPA